MVFGTIFSALAAIALGASCLAATKDAVCFLQGVQCVLLAASSVFLHVYASLPVLLLCALRNFLAAKDRFGVKNLVWFLPALIVPALLVNNRGAIGLLPVLASAEISLFALSRDAKTVKVGVAVNLALWAAYGFLIGDLVTGVGNAVLVPTALFSLFRQRFLHKRHSFFA